MRDTFQSDRPILFGSPQALLCILHIDTRKLAYLPFLTLIKKTDYITYQKNNVYPKKYIILGQ